MYSTKIGILKEGKIPIDNRVPLTPSDAQLLKIKYPEIDVKQVKSDALRTKSMKTLALR